MENYAYLSYNKLTQKRRRTTLMYKECFKAVLFCLRCNQEAIHNIKYNNKIIVQISCEDCGKTLGQGWKITASPLPRNLTYKGTLTSYASVGDTDQPDESITLERYPNNLPFQIYCKLMLSRITTKPSRLNQEMRKDLTRFLCSIPVRFITKPARIAKEFYSLKDTLHK